MQIPNMIYGTAWKKENTTNLVYEALMEGFRGIDTACQPKHYREDLVGLGLEKAYKNGINREDLFLQTKFTPMDGQDILNMPYLKTDELEIQVEKSFETSKRNLKTNFIDSYVLHSPIFPTHKLQIVWQKMEEYHEKNEIGLLGISNCYDLDVLKYLYKNARVKPKVVQNRFYSQSGYDREIRVFCDTYNIAYQSFWSLSANPHILNSETLQRLNTKYQKSVQEIFYRFLNHINITPLNGTTSLMHMKNDLTISDFELLSSEIKSIETLLY